MKLLILLAVLLVMPVSVTDGFSGYSPEDGHMAVHFIDVGQGDAVFIQTHERNLLIDGGDRGDIVPDYLKSRGVDVIHIMIGTHPHADHIGGLINVLQQIEVLEVIDPAVVHTTRTFEQYLTLIDQKDIAFTVGRAGMTRDIGTGVQMTILHPVHPSSSHLNDASVVVRISYGDISFLFTGDAEAAAEQEMISRAGEGPLNSTVLKVGHHGSRTSSTAAFLDAAAPEIAVIMTGADNRYGHPHSEVLARLSQRGIMVYRTDIHGTVVISTDGNAIHVDTHEPHDGSAVFGININTADEQELQKIIHISSVRAREIISLRPFSSLDELSRVSGIGPARIRDIREQGLAMVR